jgi:hypothetical protein
MNGPPAPPLVAAVTLLLLLKSNTALVPSATPAPIARPTVTALAFETDSAKPLADSRFCGVGSS